MIEIENGGGAFSVASLKTMVGMGIPAALREDAGAPPDEGSLVVVGLVGAWRGAVAFWFDQVSEGLAIEAFAGEPVADPALRDEALLEVVNVVAGRGVAALAGQGSTVWLTPPLLARGSALDVRLMNLEGCRYGFGIGSGSGGLLFSAAPSEGSGS